MRDQPVDLGGVPPIDRVVVGQVEQEQAVQRVLALVQRAGPGVAVRRGTPSQSSSGPAPATPQTQACASLVTGLVHPDGEKSAPASWLNSEDLPLPVPPASATTV